MIAFKSFAASNVNGIVYEFLELSFKENLPNFSECWWDQIILDLILSNLSGIVTGMLILKYLNIQFVDYGLQLPFQK